jgi:hypothetical protein
VAEVSRPIRQARCLILDTGGVFAWAFGNPIARIITLRAVQSNIPIVVPAIVLSQAIRGGRQDAALERVLKRAWILPVGETTARFAGVLLGRTSTTDAVDGVVAAFALEQVPATILTSDPGDLRTLLQADAAHPRVRVISV